LDPAIGDWTFYVYSVNRVGKRSIAATLQYTVHGWASETGPSVTTLEVKGGGNTFAGPSPTVTWVNAFPVGQIPYPVENVVRVYNTTGTLLRTEIVRQNSYTYDFDKNVNDGGPRRSVSIGVTAKDIVGQESNEVVLLVSNPVPAALSPTLSAGTACVTVKYSSSDADFAGAQIWLSSSPGINPTTTSPVYDGPDTTVSLDVPATGGTFYVRVAVYDAFGKIGLNVGPEVSITVDSITILINSVLPSLVQSLAIVTFKDIEDIEDGIANILNSITRDKDESDIEFYKIRQVLSAKADNISATVAQEISARILADGAEASARLFLDAQINDPNTGLAKAHASIAVEKQARVDADGALAHSIDLFSARVQGVEAGVANETIARANGDSALAANINTLTTTIGNHTASLNVIAASIDGTRVEFGFVGTIDGQTGGLLFTGVKGPNGNVLYQIRIKGDVIIDGTVTVSKLAANVVSAGKIVTDLLTASNIQTGTLNASVVNVINLNAASITTGTLTGNRIAVNSINADHIILDGVEIKNLKVGAAGDIAVYNGSTQTYNLGGSGRESSAGMPSTGSPGYFVPQYASGKILIDLEVEFQRIGAGTSDDYLIDYDLYMEIFVDGTLVRSVFIPPFFATDKSGSLNDRRYRYTLGCWHARIALTVSTNAFHTVATQLRAAGNQSVGRQDGYTGANLPSFTGRNQILTIQGVWK
jgi:hypothetical protein